MFALLLLPGIGRRRVGQRYPLPEYGRCPDLLPHRLVNALGPPVLHPPCIPSGSIRPEAIQLGLHCVRMTYTTIGKQEACSSRVKVVFDKLLHNILSTHLHGRRLAAHSRINRQEDEEEQRSCKQANPPTLPSALLWRRHHPVSCLTPVPVHSAVSHCGSIHVSQSTDTFIDFSPKVK